MNFDKYTIKSQETLSQAAEIAQSKEQQVIETAHLLKAMIAVDENVITFIFKKLSVNKAQVDQKIEEIISSFPKVTGQRPYLSNVTAAALTRAEGYLNTFGDEFVAIEHILMGLLSGTDKIASLLKENGLNESHLISAVKELRGGDKVTDQNAESKYRSLERYSINLNEQAKSGKIDPVIGRDEEIRRVLQILSRRTKNLAVRVTQIAHKQLIIQVDDYS